MSNKSVMLLWESMMGSQAPGTIVFLAGSEFIVAIQRMALIISGFMTAACSTATRSAEPANPTNLPDRYLQCILGRSTNVDPTRMQSASEIKVEGRYSFALRLPPVPVRAGEPPDPGDPPEPVDPRTKILADIGGLTNGVSPQFERVVDFWPRRVELMSTIPASVWANIIIIDPIDVAKGRARIFMARVKDAGTFDLARIYQGECRVGDSPAPLARR